MKKEPKVVPIQLDNGGWGVLVQLKGADCDWQFLIESPDDWERMKAELDKQEMDLQYGIPLNVGPIMNAGIGVRPVTNQPKDFLRARHPSKDV